MTRDLVTVGEHTVDAALLTPGGWVLDAGCRDFTFSRGMVERGCRVAAIDADPTVADPKIAGVDFRHLAVLAGVPGGINTCGFVMSQNPEARHVPATGSASTDEVVTVIAATLERITMFCGVEVWDAVKLDIEGAEYDILRAWPGPIARQISIEFHEHVCPRPQGVYDDILRHLGRWYAVVQHEKTRRHCTHPNYWDSLFVLRGGEEGR